MPDARPPLAPARAIPSKAGRNESSPRADRLEFSAHRVHAEHGARNRAQAARVANCHGKRAALHARHRCLDDRELDSEKLSNIHGCPCWSFGMWLHAPSSTTPCDAPVSSTPAGRVGRASSSSKRGDGQLPHMPHTRHGRASSSAPRAIAMTQALMSARCATVLWSTRRCTTMDTTSRPMNAGTP